MHTLALWEACGDRLHLVEHILKNKCSEMLVVLTSENSYTSCKKQEHFFLPSVHWCRMWSNVSERWGMFWTMFHVVFIRANIKALTCMVNLIFFFLDFSNSLMRVIIETSCQWPEALRLSSKLSLCLSHSLSLSPSVSLPLFWSFPVVLCLSPSYKCVHFSIHNSVHHMVDKMLHMKVLDECCYSLFVFFN